MFSCAENDKMVNKKGARSPSPPPCSHAKHPITKHCKNCLISTRKIVCCKEMPCHRHADESDEFWHRVAAHEITLKQRSVKKAEKKQQQRASGGSAGGRSKFPPLSFVNPGGDAVSPSKPLNIVPMPMGASGFAGAASGVSPPISDVHSVSGHSHASSHFAAPGLHTPFAMPVVLAGVCFC